MQPYLDEGKKLMENKTLYFDLGDKGVPVIVSNQLAWEIVESPTRFMKSFKFDNFPSLKAFLDELLFFQEETGHHGKITINNLEMVIEVYTHDVNDITELDQEYIRVVDHIHDDINDYFLITPEDEELYDL